MSIQFVPISNGISTSMSKQDNHRFLYAWMLAQWTLVMQCIQCSTAVLQLLNTLHSVTRFVRFCWFIQTRNLLHICGYFNYGILLVQPFKWYSWWTDWMASPYLNSNTIQIVRFNFHSLANSKRSLILRHRKEIVGSYLINSHAALAGCNFAKRESC